MKKDDVFYQAMLARDPRFDGKFFVGVKTTGIYCRPICPAKPKRENVEFFSHHLEAEKAGYRPCLRCRPESAPRSPAWIGKTATVQRAVKILHQRESLEFNEDRFADLFGVSARHLRRLFMAEIGKTPKQIAFENRLNLARQLITETALSMGEISHAAGFSSIRRFNDAFKERFKRPPREIRRQQNAKGERLCVSLPYRPPFDFDGLLNFYDNHPVGDLQQVRDGRLTRVIHFDDQVGEISVSHEAEKAQIKVEIDFPDTRFIHQIISRVRAMFDLDSDPVVVANVLEIDPLLKKILKKNPGVRLPSGWDPFEIAIATILGQLVSVKMGRSLVKDLIELAGVEAPDQTGEKRVRLFPTAKQILKADLGSLRTTRKRKESLMAFSQAIVNGTISLEPTQDVEKFLKDVMEIPGIGPWTAQYMALKALRNTDSFPSSDLILARALKIHSKEWLEQMSPWRGYAAALMWREYWKTSETTTKEIAK